MNQILDEKNNTFESNKKSKLNLNLAKYMIIFFVSIFICVVAIIFYVVQKNASKQEDKISKTLAENFSVISLYANSTDNYTAELIPSEILNPFVIGLIKIDKINLFYPILSETNSETLKIAPCKLYGPMPNSIGNLCIAGHNYVDNKLFSNVHKLQEDDIVKIYDLSGNNLNYKVYLNVEVSSDDLSCISQDTSNTKQITLITCNNVTGKRVIVKAIEI